MTLSTTASRTSYAGNGVTTSFGFAFKIWASSNLKVYLRDDATLVDTLQVLSSDYSVDIVTYPNTGNVVFNVAPASGKTVVIVRDMPLVQGLDLISSGAFAAENVEAELDKLTAQIQTIREMLGRTPRYAIGSALADLTLPEPSALTANQLIGVNGAGTGFEGKVATSLNLSAVSVYAMSLLDDPDAATARQTLGLKDSFMIAISDEGTAIATGTAKITFRMPYALTLSEIPRASLSTASSSGLPQFNIKKNGTTIFSTNITIDANEKTSVTAATPAVLSGATVLANDDEITVDIVAAGTGAKGAKIYLTGYRG